jgi:hypothetical protein
LEGLAVEVFQFAGIGGKIKGQLIRVQSLVGAVMVLIQLSVFAIPQQRMSGVGKLGPDLVGSAGDELTFH